MIPGNHDQVTLGGGVHALTPLQFAFADPKQVRRQMKCSATDKAVREVRSIEGEGRAACARARSYVRMVTERSSGPCNAGPDNVAFGPRKAREGVEREGGGGGGV